MARRIARLKITRSRTIELRSIALRAQCRVCEREVETLTTAQAAGALGVDQLTLDRLIADGSIHAILTVIGRLRVCKNSLFVK
jgi:excisionase family DNA binding protein